MIRKVITHGTLYLSVNIQLCPTLCDPMDDTVYGIL